MTDANLMEADCTHGITWYDCKECGAEIGDIMEEHMSALSICNYEWRSSHILMNTLGEIVRTIPVNHNCSQKEYHDDQHICPCGDVKVNESSSKEKEGK